MPIKTTANFSILAHPYTRLRPLQLSANELRTHGRSPGSALVWCMADSPIGAMHTSLLRQRPGGLALLVILPPDVEVDHSRALLELRRLRPHGILPFHDEPDVQDCAQVLRRPPVDLAAEVVDYLRWRGLPIDRETCHLIRRILDLSGELRSIASVSRSLYLSRRALGRRLSVQGLPVPSHWLQLGRLLRVATRLQNSEATVSSVAFEHGYPDGFSLSNQMERLIGQRPSEVRRRLGWEWLVEAWLKREARAGRFSSTRPGPTDRAGERESPPSTSSPTARRSEGGRRRSVET